MRVFLCIIGKVGWAAPRLKDAALSLDKLRESYMEVCRLLDFYIIIIIGLKFEIAAKIYLVKNLIGTLVCLNNFHSLS